MAAISSGDITTTRRVLGQLVTANKDATFAGSGNAALARAVQQCLDGITLNNSNIEGEDPA